MFRKHWVAISIFIATLFSPVAFWIPLAPVHAAPAGQQSSIGSCTELLLNGDMESNTGWLFGNTKARGRYVTERFYSPYRSILLGITTGKNIKSYSSIQQMVTVPAGSYLRLRAHVYPISKPYDENDLQELIIMDSHGKPLRRVWTSTTNANAWQILEFDLSEFTGKRIGIYFNVFNDGKGGVSAMYIDDVSLLLCTGNNVNPTIAPTNTPIAITNTPIPTAAPTNTPAATATPTTAIAATATPTTAATPTPQVATNTPAPATPTPTAPPAPVSSCKNIVKNGGFEANSDWIFGRTDLPGKYTGAKAHSGSRSVVLGNYKASSPNLSSYSSVSQKISLVRPGYTTARVSFWYFPVSDMEPADTQEAILLDANTGRTLKVLWRAVENDRHWIHKEIDITRYLGRNVILYFNVNNDGGAGRASMYVDDVALTICGPATATPTPASTSTPAPSASPNPTPNPTPNPNPTPTPNPNPTSTPIALQLPASSTQTSTPVPNQAGNSTPIALNLLSPVKTPHAAAIVDNPQPTPTPESPKTFLQTALSSLWYILIFIIIILVLTIVFLLIRLLWGQMAQEEEDASVAAVSATHVRPTQELSPVQPETEPEDELTTGDDTSSGQAEDHNPSF